MTSRMDVFIFLSGLLNGPETVRDIYQHVRSEYNEKNVSNESNNIK